MKFFRRSGFIIRDGKTLLCVVYPVCKNKFQFYRKCYKNVHCLAGEHDGNGFENIDTLHVLRITIYSV